MTDAQRIKEIEAQIAELERRWPAHSAPPNMWTELERLESELQAAREAQIEDTDARETGSS